MYPNLPWAVQEVTYERWAQEYLRSLPPEHFMEATSQATQRQNTLASLDLLQARRPDVQVFSELLVQYPRRGQRRPGQVVPDNMVVLTDQPVRAQLSYNVPLEPARPFWVLDYVSKQHKRKDYEDNRRMYERDLKVPYYLVFYPEAKELTLYRHNRRKYVAVRPNEQGRYPIAELDLEPGLQDGWVRYWYKGELLLLPAELLEEVKKARRQARDARRQAKEARRQAEEARRQIEEARRQAEEIRRQAEQPDLAAEEKRRADDLWQRLEAVERELARLRARPG
jgi:Uma2 family endonuclease